MTKATDPPSCVSTTGNAACHAFLVSFMPPTRETITNHPELASAYHTAASNQTHSGFCFVLFFLLFPTFNIAVFLKFWTIWGNGGQSGGCMPQSTPSSIKNNTTHFDSRSLPSSQAGGKGSLPSREFFPHSFL